LTVNGTPLVYDANGNLTSGGGRMPVWDAENRITQIGTTQFTYDSFGERLKKTSAGGTSLYPLGDDYEVTNGVVTKYVSVDGLGVIAKRVGSGVRR
jgi:YD repeat-containing protein